MQKGHFSPPSSAEADQPREDLFAKYVSPTKRRYAQEGKLFDVDFEITNTCPSTCKFCFSDPLRGKSAFMAKEKVCEILDDLAEAQVKQVWWDGGETLLHPDVWEVLDYAREKGLRSGMFSAGLPLTRAVARRVVEHWENRSINVFAIHIDTIDPQAFAELHDNPRELEPRMQGYRNLLEAGFLPDRVFPCITLTAPAARVFEQTLDWYVDEMGARFMEISVFKPRGRGEINRDLEPSLSDVRRAFEYRAQKLGDPNWARMGSTECTTVQCLTKFYISWDGFVQRCGQFPRETAVGNVYQKRLREIFAQHWDGLTFHDLMDRVKGKCASCENNDLCRGCRAAALYYLGDVEAADPKCWLNPEAQERYL